jgi:hypothetical protein
VAGALLHLHIGTEGLKIIVHGMIFAVEMIAEAEKEVMEARYEEAKWKVKAGGVIRQTGDTRSPNCLCNKEIT